MNFPVAGVGFLAACLCGPARAEPAPTRVCYSTAESRDKIAAHRLFDPMVLMRRAAGAARAEPVGVKLCLWSDQLVYEISLLPGNGHVDHVFIDARTGERVAPRNRQ